MVSSDWLRNTAAVLVFTTATSLGHAQELARVEVVITGIERAEGEVAIAVFSSETDFDLRENPVASVFVPADASEVSWTVELEAPAAYAFIAYQDLNGNREIDLRRLGPPKEPYGFSNNARSRFRPPSFEESKILLQPGPARLEIEIR